MKKLLILMLVLGLASLANATLTFEVRESDQTTVVADGGDLAYGSTYYAFVMGATADAPLSGGLYGPNYDSTDWANVTPSNDTTIDTGDLSSIAWYAAYYGYDFTAADSGMGPGVSTGDWFRVQLDVISTSGTFQIDLYDYAVSESIPEDSLSFNIPEPMTVALLGLGGLLLRRRK